MRFRTLHIIIAIGVCIAVVAGIFEFVQPHAVVPAPVQAVIAPPVHHDPRTEVVGHSVEGREINADTFGTGTTHLLFVGGMHGGYEWNAVLLAYQFEDYLIAHPDIIPSAITVTVIPDMNPDGVHKAIGTEGRFTLADIPKSGDLSPGRFNAHDVDLNRNFDCNWKPTSMWKGNKVSAGTAAFSEPEAQTIRDFVTRNKPEAVVFWHSQANAVYASECNKGILPTTLDVMNAYARAAGYPAIKSFDAYTITGDSEGWLASIGIPAITVELQTHETIEWDRNLAGIESLFHYFETQHDAMP